MCGVHCIVDFAKNDLAESIKAMAKATTHRGTEPPQIVQLTQINFHIAFGHNLLPISTKQIVSQPFTNTQRRYFLVWNGEIYNYKKIDQKHHFTNFTQSDTETLFNYLVAFSEKKANWGELQGIFAFIFYDTQNNRLLTARDRHGVKPLYYYQKDQKILFASEIQAFWASTLVQKNIRKEAINEYLTFKFPLRPDTFFENLYEHPNCLQIWNLETKTTETITPTILSDTPTFNPASIVSVTEKLLSEAVEKQYAHVYPPALMLSGGVDSTLLLALARRQGFDLPAFSIISDEKKFTKDANFAQKAAQIFQTPLEQICVDISFLEQLPEILLRADYPIADTAILPTYLIAQKAKQQNIRVLWNGAGADELFAGYNRHKAFYYYLKNPKFWNKLAQIASKIPFPNRQIAKFLDNIHPNEQQTFLNFASMEIKKSKVNYFESKSLLDFALHWDRENYLFSDLLKINDFWAMRTTVEVRVPYLDDTLSHFAEQIPAEFLLKNGKKWILKEILKRNGGKIFTQRRKEGFGIPFGHWIRQEKYFHLFDFLQKPRHTIFEHLSYQKAQFLWKNHQNLKADYTAELFAIYFLAVWLEGQ
jgi:asparagine synthase (glutamine-hydrolysing)